MNDALNGVLDTLMRVVLWEAIRAGVWAIVFYPMVKYASKQL